MTDAAWETLSNQAVAACGVVYFLALLAHLVEWSALRKVPVTADAAVAAEGSEGGVALATGGDGVDEDVARRTAMFGRLGLLLTVLAVAIHFVALVGRGMAADPNRVPWGNMYEFTLAGTFVVAALYLALYRKFSLAWMAPIVVGVRAGPADGRGDLALRPGGAADRGALLAVAGDPRRLRDHRDRRVHPRRHLLGALPGQGPRQAAKPTGYLARVPEPAVLDRVSYRLHAFGFPVWTFAVLITGPIWAHQAWSTYWNWDPKEVWAFITWVVYAAYLHARSTAGWKGRNAALLALLGLATLWFNFIGINFFSLDLAALVRRAGDSAVGPIGADERPAPGVESLTRRICRSCVAQSPTGRLSARPDGRVGLTRSSSVGSSGCFVLLVQVAQEVRVVVGADGRGGGGRLRRRQDAAALDHPHDQVDGHRDQDDHEQELQHPSKGRTRVVTAYPGGVKEFWSTPPCGSCCSVASLGDRDRRSGRSSPTRCRSCGRSSSRS